MREQLIELESKVAYQERAIEQLNEVLTDQEQRVARLEKQLRAVAARLETAIPPGDTSPDPRRESF